MKNISKKEAVKLRDKFLDKYFDLDGDEATLTLKYESLNDVVDENFKADQTLKLEDDFFSKLKDYIELLPKKFKVNLIININNLENHSLKEVEEIFLDNFHLLTYKLIKKNHHRWIAALLMILVGSIFFLFYSLGETYNWPIILNEFLDIACWVFYWEAVSIFFMEIFSEKRQMKAIHKRINKIKVSSNSETEDVLIK